MENEIKQKIIRLIGDHKDPIISVIAEECAKAAVDLVLKKHPSLSKSDVSPRFSDVEIAKAACRELNIDWDKDCDKYDDYMITIWYEGASWMQKALLNEG